MSAFVGRRRELQGLEEVLGRPDPQLVRLYGRRRLGKTRLLLEVLKRHPGLYFEAIQGNRAVQLDSLAGQLAEETGTTRRHLGSWDDWFTAIERSGRSPVVIDEFQLLLEGHSGAADRLRSRWDHHWQHSGPTLILCGSSVGMMQGLTAARHGPLFGRLTADVHLRPMGYDQVREFYPDLPEEERIRRFGVFGGTPFYHALALGGSLQDALLATFFAETAPLRDEPARLLDMELREPARAGTILLIVGQGGRALHDIESRAGAPSGSLSVPLRQLERELDLLVVERPMGGAQKLSQYRFSDPFFDFYYRFIQPGLARLEQGSWEGVWGQVQEDLDGYLGLVFERVVKDALLASRRRTVRGEPLLFEEVGSWWNRSGEEVDLILSGGPETWAGEVKWSRHPFGIEEVSHHLRKVEVLRRVFPDPVRPLVVARAGLTPGAARLLADHRGLALDLSDLTGLLEATRSEARAGGGPRHKRPTATG